ncbi:MAG: glycosyltransferase [Bdellovibrionales bacterium]|nr:glycosyltransferase [Oligoflexia bacterium]
MLALLLPRVSLFIWLAAILVTTYGTLVALFHLRKERKRPISENLRKHLENEEGLEPITILKPLKGIDEGIEENLESFLNLDYPKYEVLFSVADPLDPVVPLVKRIIARHPKVQASLTICSANRGPNPKINNLLSIYHDASFDWVLISDSNTRVSPGHLKLLAHQFKQGVAMQTSVVAGVDAHGVGGLLECAFLNTFYARSVLALNTLGHPCVIGKAMMFRKSVLERTGGLRSLEVHIAEDYAAGRKLHQLGFRVQVSRNPIRQYIGPYSVGNFWSRHIRWGRLRKMQTPFGFAVEPLFNSLISGALGAYAFSTFFAISPLTFFFAHAITWFLCDAVLYTRVADLPGPSFLPIWILREVLHFPLWAHIAVGNTITWRGKKIRLEKPQTVQHAYTLHDLHEFLRHPQKHLPPMPRPFKAITDTYALFDEEWEEDLEVTSSASKREEVLIGKPSSKSSRPPEYSA